MNIINIEYAYRDKFEIEEGYQPYSSIFFITKGSFKITFSEKTYILHEGDLIYLPYNLFFSRNVITPLSFYYIRIENDSNYQHLQGVLKVKNKEYLKQTIKYIFDSFNSVPITDETTNHFLHSLFFQSTTDTTLETLQKNTSVAPIIKYISHHFCEKITLDDLCYKFGYSKTSLIEKFKTHIGITPINYIVDLRIKKACEFLLNTDLSISDISEKCGFSCAYFFSNTFKKHMGLSPKDYRRQNII